jgi:arsenate reductase-like glutaredoxin family protein
MPGSVISISESVNSQDLEKIRIEFLGKKGRMTEVLHSLKDVSETDRPKLGQEINSVKVEITGQLDQKIQMLQSQEQNQKLLSEEIDITLNPPSLIDLKNWIQSGKLELKQLLNTSGIDYRAQKMSDKVKTLPVDKVLELLSKNGRLLKRPIIVDGQKVTTGFKVS